ncbi:MAG: hypothetical protein AB1646_15885 [Thermodesulfobacteriota bacterium]
MVKKLGILGFILVVVAAAGMACAQTYTGSIPAPQPSVMPASAPAPQPMVMPAGGAVKGKAPACAIPKLTTSIKVQMQYPQPVRNPFPMVGGCGEMRPPIPVAVPMWKFIVPWPPFVYYLPVE